MTSLIGLDAIAQEQGEDAPTRLVTWIRDAFGVDMAAWYDLRWTRRALGVTDGVFAGDLDIGASWMEVVGRPVPEDYFGYAPDLPPVNQTNRFVGLERIWESRRDAPRPAVYRRYYEPHGIVDQQRVLLYDGRRFLGWLGAVRRRDTPDFTDDTLRGLTDALPSARAILRAHQAVSGLHLEEAEAEGANALIFTLGGRLVHGTEGAVAWLTDRRRDHVLSLLRAHRAAQRFVGFLDGVEIGLSRLDALGRVHVLVTLSATDPAMLHPFHDLSPRQREVAEYMARGFTAPEVAGFLGISPATVRVHLKAVYAVLGITSRAELGRLYEYGTR